MSRIVLCRALSLVQITAQIVAVAFDQINPGAIAEQQALYRRAALSVVARDYEAARADARSLLDKIPGDARTMALLVVADFLSGRSREANEIYASCVACKVDSPVDSITRDAVINGRTMPFFRRILPQLSEPYPDGPQPFEAVREAGAGRYRRALVLIDTLLKSAPSRPDLRFDRGLLFLALGDSEGARADFGVATLYRPSLPDAGVPQPLDRSQQVALWALAWLSRGHR